MTPPQAALHRLLALSHDKKLVLGCHEYEFTTSHIYGTLSESQFKKVGVPAVAAAGTLPTRKEVISMMDDADEHTALASI